MTKTEIESLVAAEVKKHLGGVVDEMNRVFRKVSDVAKNHEQAIDGLLTVIETQTGQTQ